MWNKDKILYRTICCIRFVVALPLVAALVYKMVRWGIIPKQKQYDSVMAQEMFSHPIIKKDVGQLMRFILGKDYEDYKKEKEDERSAQ